MAVNYDFYLAALLYDLRLLPGFSPSGWVREQSHLFSRYGKVEMLCDRLDNGGGGATPSQRRAKPHKKAKQPPVTAGPGNGGGSPVLRRASKLAGEGELSVQGAGSKLNPLKSVFSRLSLGGSQAAPAAYYKQEPLSLTNIFPVKGQPQFDAKTVIAALKMDVGLLMANPPVDFAAFLSNLDWIFKRHLWCVPAGATPEGDISLYDRMRLTAAISFCLREAPPKAEKPYLLLAADFSGIQKYIFAVARTSADGVAKRLRARSFLVDTMIQTLAYHICEEMEVPYGNILMLSGGKFYLLLPNTEAVGAKLGALEQETAANLYQRFAGEIAVNMAWHSFGDEGLEDYSATITELSQRLRQKKNKPFQPVLTAAAGWREEAFILAEDLAGKHACASCGTALVPEGEKFCAQCLQQEQLGGKLATADQLWISRDGGEYQLWPGYWLSFKQEEAKGQLVRVELLNQWELTNQKLTRYPLSVRLMANHLPLKGKDQGPFTFSELAVLAPGSKRLAILKADVDTLGYLFADGMREGDKHYGTIARVAALSRLLEQFFAGYISYLLDKEFPTVYSVFSGGDDLFLLGPWDVMPKLALRVQKEFSRFAGGNPCVTLSAALCLAHPKTHIALLAEVSEEELKQVKNSAPAALYPGKRGRNGISFLGDIFSWEDFARQLDNIEKLIPEVPDVNTTILRRIITYSQMYRRFLTDHDVMGLMFEPLFHYDRARNYDKLAQDKLEHFFHYAGGLHKNIANYREEVNRDLYFAKTVVTCVLNQTKEVRENAE